MFTVKFFSQELARNNSKVLIVEGDEVEILPPSNSYDYFVRVTGKSGSMGREIRWVTDEERANGGPFMTAFEPYYEAVVENGNGKTTHIVRARQPSPPLYVRANEDVVPG